VPARVATDAGRVRQLLVNLAGNAIKFAGEGAVALALRTADGGKALALEVRDAGPGLPEEALAALAMPAHRRTDARPSAPGTRPGGGAGLGLSIVAELVDALGGALRVESGAAGTTFRITLPAPAVGGADADAAAHDDAVRAGTRVLVVDDDPVSRRVTAALLESLGCEVDVAGDGAAALALAGRGAAYELVMLDVQLADGDGCALAAALRERETASGSGLAATPLVALTAHADAAVRARCAAAGFAECLAKPVGRAGLAAAVARWAARPAAALPIAALPDARDVPDVLDVLDAEAVARLRDLEGYAPGLLAAVAADYAATSVRRLGEIDRAAARGDRAAVERAAHALKGASASAGATRAAECATAVMLGAAGGRADGTAGGWVDGAAIARLRGEVERAAAALASLLD
jgi:CheY-like chemotaxis protein